MSLHCFDLARDVARCDRLLGDHLVAAVQTFGAAALGVIDLPPILGTGRLVPAQLRAAATLFWAKNVEDAGLLEFVDALANGIWSGRLALPIDAGADKLLRYRRELDERFSLDERRALYEQLFGASVGFPAQWARLVEAARALGLEPEERGRAGLNARVSAAALDLAQSLSDRAVGVVGFACREIIAHVRAALDLLADRDVSSALGGGGRWSLIRLHAPQVLGRSVQPSSHLECAQAGLDILEWLAAHAAALEAGSISIEASDVLIEAAERWRAASTAELRPREAAA